VEKIQTRVPNHVYQEWNLIAYPLNSGGCKIFRQKCSGGIKDLHLESGILRQNVRLTTTEVKPSGGMFSVPL